MSAQPAPRAAAAPGPVVDWKRVALRVLISRCLDELEETRLVPERKVLYQFTSRGHDVPQTILAEYLDGEHDGASVYYRARPLALALGLTLDEALASTMMRADGISAGRDIGVVVNMPRKHHVTILPSCGGVGTQYTPGVGWAQAQRYRARELRDAAYAGSITLIHGGEGSTATNGFWAALNIATTEQLPVLFYIEDNAYAISVRSDRQAPGGNIAANLAQFRNLRVYDGDGTRPEQAEPLIARAVRETRAGGGPVLLRLTVPRLCGHSGQDTQAYKPAAELADEKSRDPLPLLRAFLVPRVLSEQGWQALEAEARATVAAAHARVEQLPMPDPARLTRYVFSETRADGTPDVQQQGGLLPEGVRLPAGTTTP